MAAEEKQDRFAGDRRRMMEWDLKGRDINDPAVLRVMEQIPRENFVPESERYRAYSDNPLSIGLGQTISQPYIVALMTQELRVNKDSEVLEIGTGSGYQAAILCKLARKVYSVERHGELAEKAKRTLQDLGINNIEFAVGDGSCGWPEEKQFDRILVTAALPDLPEPLVSQLAEGGVMVAPVEPSGPGAPGYWSSGGLQELLYCVKKNGRIHKKAVCGCRFVKLVGKYGFKSR